MGRLLIPVNIVVGIFALLVAVIFPIFHNNWVVDEGKQAAVLTVKKIAEKENQFFQENQRTRPFLPNKMPAAWKTEVLTKRDVGDPAAFEYDAHWDSKENNLVIRARAKVDEVKKAQRPPSVFTYRMKLDEKKGRELIAVDGGQWAPLSKKTPSLMGLF